MKNKIAIIGAGIIGLYLTWKLAKAGNKVFLFEKKKKSDFYEKPCSTLVSERIKNFIPIDESLIERKIFGCLINFPKKTITLNFFPAHLVLNRHLLIDVLFNLAEKSGVEIFFEKEINEIPEGFDKIIGCDGALSSMRGILSDEKPIFKLGLQLFLAGEDSSNFVQTWPTHSGFCWKIPRKNKTEYGIIEKPKLAKKLFKKFLEKFSLKYEDLMPKMQAAPIPQKLILPANEKITLCGDAAGFCKPWSGGGIIWGLKAADILIKEFPDFKKYKNKSEKYFKNKILKGKISNNLVHYFGKKFPYIFPSKINYDNDFGNFLFLRK